MCALTPVTLHEPAPAKVNLCLFLGPVREDGRHRLVTLFESITMAEQLELSVGGPVPDQVTCPGREGHNVVGAATMQPGSAYLSAVSTTGGLRTSSSHGPACWQRLDHVSHQRCVWASSRSASSGRGGGRCEGCQLSTNGTLSPARTVKSATVVISLPSSFCSITARRVS